MFTFIVFGKQREINIKRLIFISSRVLLLTIIVIFSFAVPVNAEPETVLTGCLNKKSGELHNVALGLKPFLPCAPTETQVTWTSGVPGMESRLIALEERVAELESDQTPLNLTVHCPEESVGEALAQAGNRTSHVTITIMGVCTEEVVITRDNTTLRGASPGDGIQAPSPDSRALVLTARGIKLYQLAITGGGILATQGAEFDANKLSVSQTPSGYRAGVFVELNATGDMIDSTVKNNGTGIWVTQGGVLRIDRMTIEDNSDGIEADSGGHISIIGGTLAGTVIRNNSSNAMTASRGGSIVGNNVTIENNGFGVFSFSGGDITLWDSLIRNNAKGVGANGGSTVLLGNVIVANTQDHGVHGRAGGTLILQGVTIENNGNDGISLGGGSTARISDGTIVRNNIGHGIALGDTSTATFDNTVQVIGNTGTAVICGVKGELDDVALIVGEPGIISGNGSDTIECPRGFP